MGWLIFIGIIVLIWGIPRFVLAGKDHSRYDSPRNAPTFDHPIPSTQHTAAVMALRQGRLAPPPGSGNPLQAMRTAMDEMGRSQPVSSRTQPVDADGVASVWFLPENMKPGQRLLYIHGGAFTLGSSDSHRYVTDRLAQLTGCAVLSINYRLMPEHRRKASIEDSWRAYRFLCENGPDGPSAAERVFVAGDSAGGNLTLMLAHKAKNEGYREADALIAICPATDMTMSSPSLLENADKDVLLGTMMKGIARAPRWLRLWLTLLTNRMRPANPYLSPLHGDLSEWPPTLIQASEDEVLIDDARRFTNKAREAGSDVTLQTWRHLLHVWHMFGDSPESREAFREIASFVARHQ